MQKLTLKFYGLSVLNMSVVHFGKYFLRFKFLPPPVNSAAKMQEKIPSWNQTLPSTLTQHTPPKIIMYVLEVL